jgi:hypothetical protein
LYPNSSGLEQSFEPRQKQPPPRQQFESNRGLTELQVLKHAGLKKIRLQRFPEGLIDIRIDTAFNKTV